ncbi:hypothetical protein [Maricaulis parjimensis]|uniref:hypothetical protein n=1 Tax=Maricaulis parjimensis TaxID=144023 RepID=UPI00193ACE3B|nr:hypothetical protein [Maricaulis parjimensis]
MTRTTFLLISVAVIAVLACGLYLGFGYFRLPEVSMGLHGWIALGLGTVLSIIVGGGLSAILIISRRRGFDEAAHEVYRQIDPDRFD